MRKLTTTCDFCGNDTENKSITVFEENKGIAFKRIDVCPACWEKGLAAMSGFEMVKVQE